MLPHCEGEEVGAGEMACEHARGLVEVSPDVDVLHVEGQRRLVLLPDALAHGRGRPGHGEGRARLLRTSGPGLSLRGAVWVGQAGGQMVCDVAAGGDVRVDQVAGEGDVRASVAVQSVAGALLQKHPHGVHLPQGDHDALALNFPPCLAVVVVGYGLHLLAVLHQDHREHLLWEFAHREGEVVSSGDAAAEVASVRIEIPSDVDHEPVEGDGLLLPSQHAVGASGRES